MRYEVLSECLHRTQVYLRWHRGQLALHTFVLNNATLPELDAPRCIQSFRLLTQYTHVSLQWEPCLCLRNSEGIRTENLAWDWLLRLERFTTLELIISNRWVTLMEGLHAAASERDVKANDLFVCSRCFPKLMKLRNLEKVVVKVVADSDSIVVEKGEVEGLTWLSSTKKEISDVPLKAPSQVRKVLLPLFFMSPMIKRGRNKD
ncbi:hypothetical protein SMAC4_13635 [Sordaria macrospora]|uniref:uncharacterized protein n=1 Tax=Sordaria macrospora TaxID=5147 RepID=UPI002B2BAD19|nr:hypothetical protein SMAC4_13635 [Sordaria macrospora]